MPPNDHDDPANLTLDKFVEAAEAAGITLKQCVDNVFETYEWMTDNEPSASAD